MKELCANREAFTEDRKTLSGKISNLVLALSMNPTSPSLLDGLRDLEAQAAQYDSLLAKETAPVQHATEAEIDAFLTEALPSLAAILRGDAMQCRQEIKKRVGQIVLHPVVEDGRVKFKIEGFFKVFFGDEPLLLESTCQCITRQQGSKGLNLEHLILEGGQQPKTAKILAFPSAPDPAIDSDAKAA